MTDHLAKRINKKVSFRFCGRDLYFYLSMGLFSSFDIDTGTKLFLRNLSEHIDFSKIHNLLDSGCGTGVIAISLKKAFPHISIDALDRDFLALEITSENAQLNNTEISVFPGLDTLAVQPHRPEAPFENRKKYDLITTNIPAKAGFPVLRRFFLNGLASLSKEGYLAVVIVAPLHETAIHIITELGAAIVFKEHTAKHSVFFIQCNSAAGREREKEKTVSPLICDTSFPGPYLRKNSLSFMGKNISYTLSTVFDLAGFDTTPIPSAASAELYAKLKPNQNTFLFWNPGQGHSAVMVLKTRFNQTKTDITTCQCVLTGRDVLALLISYFNIKHEFPEISCCIVPAAGMDFLPREINMVDNNTFDFIVIEPDIIPGFSFTDTLNMKIPGILSSMGKTVVAGKSSDIGRLTASTPSFTVTHSKKTKGFRSVVFTHKIKE